MKLKREDQLDKMTAMTPQTPRVSTRARTLSNTLKWDTHAGRTLLSYRSPSDSRLFTWIRCSVSIDPLRLY